MRKKILVLMMLTVILLTGCGKETNPVGKSGKVTFTAVDGLTGQTIPDVRVVVPEGDLIAYTNDNGRTEAMTVPVIEESNVPMKKKYGTFTVLAYAEGYCDFCLFYAQLLPDQERNVKIFLFQKDSPMASGAPLATVESPENEWVKTLADRYRK